MLFLPDTNALIAWTVRSDPRVIRWLADRRGEIALSAIVLHELFFGAFNSDKVDRNPREVDALGIPPLAFDRDDARAAGEVRATLRRAGTPIGPYDALIAGQALARDLTVVTANVREFARVKGLRIEDWTQA